MIKHVLSLTVLLGATMCASSQTTPVQSSQPNPGNYNNTGNYNYNNQPRPYNGAQPGSYNTAPGYAPNQAATGGVLFSNQVGQTFSAQDLAAQLQNLRSAIDQTIPILSAFNESYSNSNNGKGTVGSALSGIVSDVLHRNQGSTQTTTGQSSTTSNLLSVLHGLLNKNGTPAPTASTPNPQDLISLQNDLQPVVSVLQRLNVNGVSNQINSPYPNGGLTPTGR